MEILLVIFVLFVLADGLTNRHNSAAQSVSNAVQETKNSIPVFLAVLVIIGILLLTGTIAR